MAIVVDEIRRTSLEHPRQDDVAPEQELIVAMSDVPRAVEQRFSSSMGCLRELCMSNSQLAPEHLGGLVKILQSNIYSLRRVDLSRNPSLGSDGAEIFARELQDNRHLESLNWNDNNAGLSGFIAMSPLLLCTNIQHFFLARNRAGPRALVEFFRDLHYAQSATLIDLQGNGFNRESMEVLAETLAEPSCCVSYLVLSYTDLNAQACKRLFSALQTNRNLISLQITGGPDSVIDDLFVAELQNNARRRRREIADLVSNPRITDLLVRQTQPSDIFDPNVLTIIREMVINEPASGVALQ